MGKKLGMLPESPVGITETIPITRFPAERQTVSTYKAWNGPGKRAENKKGQGFGVTACIFINGFTRGLGWLGSNGDRKRTMDLMDIAK